MDLPASAERFNGLSELPATTHLIADPSEPIEPVAAFKVRLDAPVIAAAPL